MMTVSPPPTATGMQARLIGAGNRLHLQHGPIDMIIDADGRHRSALFTAATEAGISVLATLVEELPLLRARHHSGRQFAGPVARRMQAACHLADGRFVTPMIAVAGAVADHILAAMLTDKFANDVTKISVNNGGDVAFWIAPNTIAKAQLAGVAGGMMTISGPTVWRGLATSGWQGRSHSLGIADSVSVLARTAANADIAATLIANSVTVPSHRGIERVPANSLNPESDLGDRLVTIAVPPLPRDDVFAAVDGGRTVAQQMLDQEHIAGAVISLQGHTEIIGMTGENITPDFVKDNNRKAEKHYA